LREAKAQERRTKAREEYNDAKEAVTKRFLETDPEGMTLVGQYAASSGYGGASTGALASMGEVQKRVREILKKRAEDQKAADKTANEAAAERVKQTADAIAAEKEAQDFAEQAIADATKTGEADGKKADEAADKADKAKKEKERKDLAEALDAKAKLDEENAAGTGKLTVSSLRDIGGGLAGEAMVNALDIQQKQLDISQAILIELQKLNVKTLPEYPASTNFTKTLTTA